MGDERRGRAPMEKYPRLLGFDLGCEFVYRSQVQRRLSFFQV